MSVSLALGCSGGRQPVLQFLEFRRGFRILCFSAQDIEGAPQGGDGGIFEPRAGLREVDTPVGHQFRLETLVVSIIDDGVEYHRAHAELLYAHERQLGGGDPFGEATVQVRRRIGTRNVVELVGDIIGF